MNRIQNLCAMLISYFEVLGTKLTKKGTKGTINTWNIQLRPSGVVRNILWSYVPLILLNILKKRYFRKSSFPSNAALLVIFTYYWGEEYDWISLKVMNLKFMRRRIDRILTVTLIHSPIFNSFLTSMKGNICSHISLARGNIAYSVFIIQKLKRR